MTRWWLQQGDFLGLLADLSARFVDVASDGVDDEIFDAQRRVCEILELDVSTVWQAGEEWPGDLRLTHHYRSHEGPDIPEPMFASDHFPWSLQQMLAGRTLAFSTLEEMPAEAEIDREGRRRLGIRSALNLPLATGGGPVTGVLTFATLRTERTWPDELVQRLQLIAQMFANALARKRSEQALRQSEQRLQVATEAAGVGLWSLDLTTGRIWVNARLRRLFPVAPGVAPTYRDFRALVHPDDRDRVHRAILRAWEAEAPLRVDYRVLLTGGGTRWISARGRLHRDPAGRPDRLTGTSLDITSRMRVLEALAESERRFRATFEQAAVGIAHLGLDGRFLRVNQRFGDIVGYGHDELLGRAYTELLHPDALARHVEHAERMCRGELETYTLEKRYLRRSGTPVWVSVTSSLVRTDSGEPGWVVTVAEEISNRKQAEEELNRFRAQLWHADRAAQVGVITASLAHELNQPLAAILTNAQAGLRFLAAGNPDLREIRDILADIVQDDKRAGSVVAGLRAMLRRRETLRETIRLAAALREVLDLLHSEMLARSVRSSLRQESDPLVAVDRTQIQQVLLNLAMNALDAMQDQPEPRRLDLALTRSSEGGQVIVSVSDTGPGVSEEQEGRLFEPFWTTKATGMGIGLAISRTIIESHGGQMGYRNNDDRGATFFFTLPAEEPDLRRGRAGTILHA